MRRLLRKLIVIAGVTGLVMALNVGVALAHDGPHFDGANGGNVSAPVGNHILGDVPGHPGADNGFGRLHVEGGPNDGDEIPGPGGTNLDNPAIKGLTHNPNCPLHYMDH